MLGACYSLQLDFILKGRHWWEKLQLVTCLIPEHVKFPKAPIYKSHGHGNDSLKAFKHLVFPQHTMNQSSLQRPSPPSHIFKSHPREVIASTLWRRYLKYSGDSNCRLSYRSCRFWSFTWIPYKFSDTILTSYYVARTPLHLYMFFANTQTLEEKRAKDSHF